MKEIIAVCGLSCHECLAYLATQADDNEKRKELAEVWSKEYGRELAPSAINCNGCPTEGEPVFGHCRVCEIRACGKERGVATCAHCDDYVCEKLETFFAMAPMCREKLESIRQGL